MKKIIRLLLISVFAILSVSATVSADDRHIYVDDEIASYFVDQDEPYLNQEMHNLELEYGISTYFIYDNSIGDDNIIAYTENFINNHSPAKNNVVLCLNANYYVVKATGPDANRIIGTDEARRAVFEAYYNGDDLFYGIQGFYQYVIKIINDETYQSGTIILDKKTLVYDGANLMTDTEESDLLSRLTDVSNRYGVDVAVLTTNTLNGMTPRAFCDDYYDYNGFNNNGLVFMLSMEDRDWYVSTKGSCEKSINDDVIDYIFSDMKSDLSKGNYYDAFTTYANEVDYYINYYNQKGDGNNNPTPKRRTFGMTNIAISGFVALIVSLIYGASLKSQLKSVQVQRYAGNYVVSNSFHLTGYSDMFINKHVSRTPRPHDTGSSSSSSSGSSHSYSSHTSSSGSSHGGHGGKF